MQNPPVLPEPVLAAASHLRRAGHEAWLVGESLHARLRGERPAADEIATDASLDEIPAVFQRAVPTHPERDTAMLPSATGPIDVTRFRDGRHVGDDLDHRAFSVLALAFDPLRGELRDPHGGVRALREGRLESVGEARERAREDPFCALQAARLIARFAYAPAPGLARALGRIDTSTLPRRRVRREIARILLAPRPAAAIAFLRDAGIEAALVPDARPDAGAIVESLPAELVARLVAWLPGDRPERSLRRLGFHGPVADRVCGLLRHHPIDEHIAPREHAALRRLHSQIGPEGLALLFRIRREEQKRAPESEAERIAERLAALAAALARVEASKQEMAVRADLALDGRSVMRALGCGPGRRVGAALRYLTDCVRNEPGCNDPAALSRRLAAWAEEHPE